jgi:hypothetical protein
LLNIIAIHIQTPIYLNIALQETLRPEDHIMLP